MPCGGGAEVWEGWDPFGFAQGRLFDFASRFAGANRDAALRMTKLGRFSTSRNGGETWGTRLTLDCLSHALNWGQQYFGTKRSHTWKYVSALL
jgi:hypothetical protein